MENVNIILFFSVTIICFECFKETTSRDSNNVIIKRTSINFINSPKRIPQKLTTRTFPSTLNIPKRKSLKPHARTVNLEKLSKHTVNKPTFRTRTLDSPLFKTKTLNYATLNPYIPEGTLNPALKKRIDSRIHDVNLEEWFEDTNVNYTVPDDESIDTRRSQIDGIYDFKKLVTKLEEQSKKRSQKYIDKDIVINDKFVLDTLRVHDPVPPNFDESFAATSSKRLNEIQAKYIKFKSDEEAFKSARRIMISSSYEDDYKSTKKPNSVDRILALMDQFIFQAQQKLINGELLKVKYNIYVKYKIGYTFSLLRILKQQQLRLYSSMHFYRFYTPTEKGTWYDARSMDNDYYLSLYEKVNRLDDDIITLVNYMWELEKIRRIEAAIEATKFPKRKKFTPALKVPYYMRKTT